MNSRWDTSTSHAVSAPFFGRVRRVLLPNRPRRRQPRWRLHLDLTGYRRGRGDQVLLDDGDAVFLVGGGDGVLDHAAGVVGLS